MGYYQGSYNGCGWVATYNATLMLGKASDPADIIYSYDKYGGTVGNGIFGVNPLAIKLYFDSIGVESNMYNLPVKADERISSSHVSILAYAHSNGAHYVAIQYVDGKYYVYNYRNQNSADQISSIDSWLKDYGYTAISLITIGKPMNSISADTSFTTQTIY